MTCEVVGADEQLKGSAAAEVSLTDDLDTARFHSESVQEVARKDHALTLIEAEGLEELNAVSQVTSRCFPLL